MTQNLEARLKAIEDMFIQPTVKMSTMKAPSDLKDIIDEMKEGTETQADVMWRMIEEAEKVPVLEKENAELKMRITELEGGK